MKNLKLLLIVSIAFAFTACNKCKECEADHYYNNNSSGSNSMNSEENFGHQIIEVCRDNFDSKEDFNNYIDNLEENDDWDCKSDFWN